MSELIEDIKHVLTAILIISALVVASGMIFGTPKLKCKPQSFFNLECVRSIEKGDK